MQTLKSLLDQSLLIWNDATGAGRIGIALLLLICVGSVVGIGVWSAQPNYVVLASGITPSQASKMIDSLDSAGIAYQIKGSGSIILVDKQKWSRAKLAAGQLGIDNSESEMEETSPWMDPTSQQNTFRRNLERRLERSIAKFKNVTTAKVHLSIPERQAFIRQSNAPSAAVVLEISSKTKFSDSHAHSIASMVANSVPGLMEENVSISDTLGNNYTVDETSGQLSKQEEFRVMRDRELAQKAQAILSPFLGVGNTSVAVTTDFTFPMGTKTTKEFDPDRKVLVNEQVKSTTSRAGDSVASGAAGTASNVGGGGSGNRIGQSPVVSKTEDLSNRYEISSTSRTESMQTPILNMMTVSVLVNQATVQDESGAVPPDVRKKVVSLVSQAVGLRSGTDQISVEFFTFVESEDGVAPLVSGMPWEQINNVLRNISLGVAALVALFIGMRVIKKFQPEPVVASSETSEGPTSLGELSEMVQQNPEVFAKIIANWASTDMSDQSDVSSKAA